MSKDWDYNTRSIYAYIVISFDGDKVNTRKVELS